MTRVNQSFDDDERALARALHGRVEQMNDSPLGAHEITDKAHALRRRRRVVAAAGIAAAVAVIVPSVLLAGSLLDRDSSPPPATETPSMTPSRASDDPSPDQPTPSDTAPPAPTSQVLDVSDLETGAAPGLAYAELAVGDGNPVGGTLYGVDGGATPLPPYALMEFAPLGERWVVSMYDPDADVEYVLLLEADGEVVDRWLASGGFALSPGGNVAAWTAPDGTVSALVGGTGDPVALEAVPGPGSYRTIGVIGEDCAADEATGDGCSVLVNRSDRQTKALVTSSAGGVQELSGLMYASASDEDHIAGVTSVDESVPGSCSRMLDGASRAELWVTCDHTLATISPDGAHLLGLPAYLDGFGPTSLAILDMADGSPVRSWTGTARSATYFDEVWEDDAHVLVVAYQAGEWAVVRLGVDGSMEYAREPVPGEDLSRPVMLQTR